MQMQPRLSIKKKCLSPTKLVCLYYNIFLFTLALYVVAIRKAFDVTSMYKSLFSRKSIVLAAGNLPVHVFSFIGKGFVEPYLTCLQAN